MDNVWRQMPTHSNRSPEWLRWLKNISIYGLIFKNKQPAFDIHLEHNDYMLVCLGIFVLLENFSHIWRRHHYWWRATNFDLYSALMAIEQWGFFSVPHLLWQGPTFYNSHLRWPATLTPIAKQLTVELSLPVLIT